MLNAGSCPYATDEDGDCSLHYLTQSFIWEVEFNETAMQILLKAGINLDQANAKGVTPLMNLKELKLKLAQKKNFLTLISIPFVKLSIPFSVSPIK